VTAARVDAEPDAGDGGHQQGGNREDGGVGSSAHDQCGDRPTVEKGVAEVEAARARQPESPLLEWRSIEVEARADRCDLLRLRAWSELRRHIRRREARQQEGGG
jgi:hypothetical protein